jgi:hypothetical protein
MMLFLFGSFLLFIPTPIGTADNSDFIRVIQPIGLTSNDNLKFYYFQQKYNYIQEFDSLFQHTKFIFNPDLENHAEYRTTQFLLVKIAQLINGVVYYVKDGVIARFDIRTMGMLLLIVHCTALVLLWRNFRIKNKWWNIGQLLIMIIIYFDVGYLVYYNSFFGICFNQIISSCTKSQ